MWKPMSIYTKWRRQMTSCHDHRIPTHELYRFFGRAGEAVDDSTLSTDSLAAILVEAFFAQYLDEVLMRSTGVQEQGQMILLRQRQLRTCEQGMSTSNFIDEDDRKCAYGNAAAVPLLVRSVYDRSLL